MVMAIPTTPQLTITTCINALNSGYPVSPAGFWGVTGMQNHSTVKFELSLNSESRFMLVTCCRLPSYVLPLGNPTLTPCNCCPQYYAQGEASDDEYETEPKSFTPDVFTLQCLVITLSDPNPFTYYCVPPSKRGLISPSPPILVDFDLAPIEQCDPDCRKKRIHGLWHGQKSGVFELEASIAGTNDHLEYSSPS